MQMSVAMKLAEVNVAQDVKMFEQVEKKLL